MLLTFSKKFPDGKPTNFRDKITWGQKRQTIRAGHRWTIGDKIHFWEGTPRNPGADPEAFNPFLQNAYQWVKDDTGEVIPISYLVDLGVPENEPPPRTLFVPTVSVVQRIEIQITSSDDRTIIVISLEDDKVYAATVIKDEHGYHPGQILGQYHHVQNIQHIIAADGLTLHQFVRWFGDKKKEVSHFKGQLIRW